MKPLTRQQTTRLQHFLDQREAAARIAREGAQCINKLFSELATPVGDEAERAFAQQVVDENLGMTAHLMRELGAVAQARFRLDAGKNGICVDCHRDISFPRLLDCPTAQSLRALPDGL